MKVPEDWTTCTFANANKTSSNKTFTFKCNGNKFSNPGYVLHMNGSVVPTYSGTQPCSAFFTVSGREVWAKGGAGIITAVAKFANQFEAFCPHASSVTHVTFPPCGD
jgi:hypothetical protein